MCLRVWVRTEEQSILVFGTKFDFNLYVSYWNNWNRQYVINDSNRRIQNAVLTINVKNDVYIVASMQHHFYVIHFILVNNNDGHEERKKKQLQIDVSLE